MVGENHLRWESPGKFLALAVSLEDVGIKAGNSKAKLLAKTLAAATGKLLDNKKSPSPRTSEFDHRGSQFCLAMYWAQEQAAQTKNTDLQAKFAGLAEALAQNEEKIVAELAAVHSPTDRQQLRAAVARTESSCPHVIAGCRHALLVGQCEFRRFALCAAPKNPCRSRIFSGLTGQNFALSLCPTINAETLCHP